MQIIYLINLKDIRYVGEQVFISATMQKIKQSKPGNHIYTLSFTTYREGDKTLCCCLFEKIYLTHTKLKRPSDLRFISYTKPHQVINKDTLTRSNKVNQKMIFIHLVLKLIQEDAKLCLVAYLKRYI